MLSAQNKNGDVKFSHSLIPGAIPEWECGCSASWGGEKQDSPHFWQRSNLYGKSALPQLLIDQDDDQVIREIASSNHISKVEKRDKGQTTAHGQSSQMSGNCRHWRFYLRIRDRFNKCLYETITSPKVQQNIRPRHSVDDIWLPVEFQRESEDWKSGCDLKEQFAGISGIQRTSYKCGILLRQSDILRVNCRKWNG